MSAFDEIAARWGKPSRARRAIKLDPGEEQPRYALDMSPPDGYRWETDTELRERIMRELEDEAKKL